MIWSFNGRYKVEKIFPRPALREKCPYFESFCFVFSRIQTRITPNTDIFYAVLSVSLFLLSYLSNTIQHSIPSWHSDVVTTLSQRRCWRCHNVVARSKMRVVPTLVSDVVTTSLSNVVKTLPQRCYNVTTTLSIGLVLGHFTMDYSDFFPFTETWKLQKC